MSIRQLGTILEALGEAAPRSKNPLELAEFVRARLARSISARYRDKQNRMFVVTLDPALEDRVAERVAYGERGWSVQIPPHEVEAICARIDDATAPLSISNRPHVVLASPHVRASLKQLTAPRLPRLVVLGSDEITRDTHIESVALIDDS